MVNLLLDHGAQLEKRTAGDHTPLILASQAGHAEVVARLIRAGADIRARSFLTYTPLQTACLFGHLNVVNCLLNAGADPESLSSDTSIEEVNPPIEGVNTPLYIACEMGIYPIVQRLLEAGANPNQKVNVDNALTVAIRKGHADTTGLLLVSGATLNVEPFVFQRSIEKVIQNNDTEIARVLGKYAHEHRHMEDSRSMANLQWMLNAFKADDIRPTLYESFWQGIKDGADDRRKAALTLWQSMHS